VSASRGASGGGRPRSEPPPAIVALGSNRGDSLGVLRATIRRLERLAASGFRASSLWRSAPVDCPPGSPAFLNAVVLFQPWPNQSPEELLGILQNWERQCGRRPKRVINEPRPLDLDLIAFGNERRSTPRLTLPHPRAHLRRFVLAPLNEIAPDLVLPGWTSTVGELLAGLPPDPSVERFGTERSELPR
jgi:2-amino-4-hydroxy-6-hydroxymethyldihydropteridine diphosphokinase